MVPELDIAPRTSGRAAVPVKAELVRELAPSDLALLASERSIKAPGIKKLRDRHHALARCLVGGMSNTEASAITGYDPSRISILKSDPTFQELMADYRTKGDAAYADFVERTQVLSLTAIENLQARLEDDDNPLPASMELEIAKFAADRTGHAPVQKSLNVNANVDLGSKLDAARRRLAAASHLTVVASGDATSGDGPEDS